MLEVGGMLRWKAAADTETYMYLYLRTTCRLRLAVVLVESRSGTKDCGLGLMETCTELGVYELGVIHDGAMLGLGLVAVRALHPSHSEEAA
jgi:hypothetical protein